MIVHNLLIQGRMRGIVLGTVFTDDTTELRGQKILGTSHQGTSLEKTARVA